MLGKNYEPHTLEQSWYKKWEQSGYFKPNGKGSPYCIVIPPPNVTGTLHMGHGFQMSIMDALIRYHRMCGDNTLWQLGTDHSGIAAQMLVENILHAEGQKRSTMGREAFLKRMWEWKDYSNNTIVTQKRRLGVSGDWTRTKFTLDPKLTQAVHTVFIQLYNEGLIYRGKRLVNWDPVLQTAISDLEVINEEQEGSLWYIKYPVVGSEEHVIIATTRPETMLGDVAVAVHPQDERYRHLHGKHVHLPLTKRTIPIITDTYVDQTFGSGCLKITPAHDFNDYAIGQRHKLPLINIFTPTAHLNTDVPPPYQGMESLQARKQIVDDLQDARLLAATEKHTLKIPKGDRSNAIIEPYLTDQWFVNAKELALPAYQAALEGKIKFIPHAWQKTYLQWLENIEDWCISRQLWWGHRIPAWYDGEQNIYVGYSEEDVRKKFNLGNRVLHQDEDVLDTWFSAALWPFATLGWPEKMPEFETFYPTSVLVTGFDIIFFWVARMVMFGLKFTGEVPFRDIYITGLIRDSHGQKMSKSKGNILDPIDLADGITLDELLQKRTSHLIQKHLTEKITKQTRQEFPQGIQGFGIDALRFTFCSLATTSRDINFDIARLAGYRNFCTKIWNATRYVMLQTENFACDCNGTITYSLADKWILTELQRTLKTIHAEFANYRFDLVTQAIYEFTWYQFCDWYLELVKPILNAPRESALHANADLKRGAQYTLLTVLEMLLRIIHPFMPFITEELWQVVAPKLGHTGTTIMLQQYPQVDEQLIDEASRIEMNWLKNVILAIRNIRGEMNISPAKKLTVLLEHGTEQDRKSITKHQEYLLALAKISTLTWRKPQEPLPPSASVILDKLELHIVLEDQADICAEVTRLNKELAKLQKEITLLNNRLQRTDYVTNAPCDVVERDRMRLTEAQSLVAKLEKRLLACTGNT